MSTTAPSTPAATALPVAEQVVLLKLGDCEINLHQPRRWLPRYLREKVGRNQMNAAEAVFELLQLAGSADLEAQGYVASLRTFAHDIAQVGMTHPIRVLTLQSEGRLRYQILVGERRFWACVFLAAKQQLSLEQTLRTTIGAIVDGDVNGMTFEEAQRIQWSENLRRADVPLIDFAELVSQVYNAQYARVQSSRAAVLDELNRDDLDDAADSAIAVILTGREIEKLRGEGIGEKAIFAYVGFVEKIVEAAKSLARAYGFSKHDLEKLARTSPDAQLVLAEKLLSQRESNPVNAAGSESERDKPGRPTRAVGLINACLRLPDVLARSDEKKLARLSAEELQDVHGAVQQAQQSLGSYAQLVQRVMTRPGLVEARNP